MRRLPATVVTLGFVSFFNDLASEMVTPLVPLVLAGALGAGPVALGVIEGVAEAVSAWLKVWAGARSDGGARKPWVLAGYALSNLVRPLFGVAGSWLQLASLRAVDRVGKGLRSAPRDALVADATPQALRGTAYGFHRAMDNAGAFLGALVAAAAVAWGGLALPQVMLWSAVPGAIGVLLVWRVLRDAPRAAEAAKRPPLRWALLPRALRGYLVLVAAFGLARASETFVVWRGHELGCSAASLLVLWALMSLAKSGAAMLGGRLADHIGARAMLRVGWAALALGYLLLGGVTTAGQLWAAALAYGVLAGLSEGVERALVGALVPAALRGSAFGWYYLLSGAVAIPAGAAFGAVWQAAGAATAFCLVAALAGMCTLATRYWLKETN
ncbi:MFS transporter [Niveibacterium umoris]|uniref:MFS family permease n=1 Tax=Niveibacterium umoris TaxID=1193620 RepID=A0A840BGG5_9RHOO|nr:MFS transporter [Niveibacterium umoris]MBB4012641.1 MFS family permease [Niveibacterium umoris]